MKKPFALLTTILFLFLLSGLVIGITGDISADSETLEPINFYPDRVSLIEYSGFLSPPSERSAGVIVSDYLATNLRELGLSAADISGAKVTDMYSSKANGVTHLYYQQTVDGKLVDDAYINANVTADGRINLVHYAAWLVQQEGKRGEA